MTDERRPGPRIPAVIDACLETGQLPIAGLSLLDRLVVALHRGGAGPITLVTTGKLPSLERARALGIPFAVAAKPPDLDTPVLLASAVVLVQPQDVQRCLAGGGALLSSTGELLPIGVAKTATPAVDVLLHDTPRLRPVGVACLVRDAAGARAAAAALWASMTSSSDGFIDRVFNRPCGRPLSKLLIHTPVSPNTISVISILTGVVAALCFAQGQWGMAVLGGILFQLSAVIDCIDGDIARVLFKESRWGKWLDLAGDQIVHVSVFAGVAWGLVQSGGGTAALWLGASAMAGALISFAVVVRGMRQRSREHTLWQRLIDAATNRDFSVLVLVLACWNELGWFLWLAAVGSHLFWVAALGLQLHPGSGRPIRE